jgi:hypothetical protein
MVATSGVNVPGGIKPSAVGVDEHCMLTKPMV